MTRMGGRRRCGATGRNGSVFGRLWASQSVRVTGKCASAFGIARLDQHHCPSRLPQLMMRIHLKWLIGALVLVCPLLAGAQAWTEDEMVLLSGAASPRVAMGVRREGATLAVAIEAGRLGEPAPRVSLGVAAGKSVVLEGRDPQAIAGGSRYLFTVPAGSIVTREEEWGQLRLGIAVSWPGGALGQDRQRERFRHIGGAAHLGLSADPADWLPLNLTEHALAVEDRRNRAWISFEQPVDEIGRASCRERV